MPRSAMDAAASRIADNTAEESLNIPSGADVAYLGVWSAASGGTFHFMFPLGNTKVGVAVAKSGEETLTLSMPPSTDQTPRASASEISARSAGEPCGDPPT